MAVDSRGAKNEPQFSDSGAPDIGVDPSAVAEYAAKVGNRRVGSTAERLAATGADLWQGLEWYDTTENRIYEYNSGWVRLLRFNFGYFSGSSNGSGLITVSHGLPSTPVVAFADDDYSTTDPTFPLRKVKRVTSSSTQIQFVLIGSTGSPLASNPVSFSWVAFY